MRLFTFLLASCAICGCGTTAPTPAADGASSPRPLTLANVTRTCPGLTEEEASIIQANLENAMSASGVSYEGALEGSLRVCEYLANHDACAACVIDLTDEVYGR